MHLRPPSRPASWSNLARGLGDWGEDRAVERGLLGRDSRIGQSVRQEVDDNRSHGRSLFGFAEETLGRVIEEEARKRCRYLRLVDLELVS